LKFIADALRVYTEDGEVCVESVPRPSGWNEVVLGTCRIAISSDAPDKPVPAEVNCTGEAVVKSSVDADGSTRYWAECT
jgi:hypothetical protein